MAFGFEILNANGRVVINQNTQTFRVVSSGYSYSVAGPESASSFLVNYIPIATNPGEIVFIRITNKTACKLMFNTWGGYGGANMASCFNSQNTATTIHWVKVKHSPTNRSDGWGIRVYDASGNDVFNSLDMQFPVDSSSLTSFYPYNTYAVNSGVYLPYAPSTDYFMMSTPQSSLSLVPYAEVTVWSPSVTTSATNITYGIEAIESYYDADLSYFSGISEAYYVPHGLVTGYIV